MRCVHPVSSHIFEPGAIDPDPQRSSVPIPSKLLARLPRARVALVSWLLLMLVGSIDYLSGIEISCSIFYLLPISLATWYAGRREGAVLAVACATTWGAVEYWGGAHF